MEAERYKTDCELLGTKICDFLGCDGCDFCVFKNGMDKHSDAEKIASNWEVTLSYLPEDIDDVHDTETCVFCGKNHADGYAELSLAHPEPEHKKGIILGLGKKVRTSVGSMIDLPIAVCKDCKRKIRMKDVIQIGGGVIVAAIAIGLLLIPGVETALNQLGWAAPLLVFALLLAIGWSAVYFIGENYHKKLAEKIYGDPLKIPVVSRAVLNGWFPIPEVKRGFARVNFVKRKQRVNFRYFAKSGHEQEQQ